MTWKFHVKVVHVQNESFDMELHVKNSMSPMSNAFLATFDMEIPCQIFLGVQTCTSDKKKAKAKSESKSKKLQAKQKRQAKAISKKQKAKAIAQIKSKQQT